MKYWIIESPTRGVVTELDWKMVEGNKMVRKVTCRWSGRRNDPDTLVFFSKEAAFKALAEIRPLRGGKSFKVLLHSDKGGYTEETK